MSMPLPSSRGRLRHLGKRPRSSYPSTWATVLAHSPVNLPATPEQDSNLLAPTLFPLSRARAGSSSVSRRWVNVLRHDRQLRCPSRRAPLRVHVPVSPTCSYGCPIHPEFSYRHEQDATCSPKYFSVYRYDTANARPAGSPSHVSPGWRLIPSGSLAAAASWSRRRPYHKTTSYTRACKAPDSPPKIVGMAFVGLQPSPSQDQP